MNIQLRELLPIMDECRSGHLYALCAAQNVSAVPLAVTLTHRLLAAEVPVAYLCAAATHQWLLREIAWEDVQVSSPWHYRGSRTPSEEQQLRERIRANRGKPFYLLSVEQVPIGALEATLRALPRLPQVVIVDGALQRQDTEPVALRRLAITLQVPVLLLCSLVPEHEDDPKLPDVPGAVTASADVLLAIGNPCFGEEQNEEAIPDYFYTPVIRLGEEPAATVLLRFDLTTNRFAWEV
jgi:hypothetical protein